MNNELDFREVEDTAYYNITPYSITPADPQKRLRVLGGWVINGIIEDLTLENASTSLRLFMKQCDHLSKRIPILEELGYINEVRFDFWARYQHKLKLLNHHNHKLHRYQAMKDLQTLRML